MKKEKRQLITLITLLTLCINGSVAWAQESPQLKKEATLESDFQHEPGFKSASTFKYFQSRYFGKVVQGAPYSAVAITEHVQTLGDGNRIIRKDEVKIYRDSQGRTRREQKLAAIGKWTASGEAPQMIYINDPVAGLTYNLDPRTRTGRQGTVSFKYQDEKMREQRIKEQEERLKENEKRHREQVERHEEESRKRQERLKEHAREHEEQVKKQAREREENLKQREKEREAMQQEREKIYRERNAEREKEYRELSEERVKQHEEHAREIEKRHKEQAKEREQQLKLREKLRKEHVQRIKEEKERKQVIEKQHKEHIKQNREVEKRIKAQEKPPKKEISNADGQKNTESLGKQTIEGVEAEGKRSTRTIPAGEIGNTLPIEIIDEAWYSADLQVQVMTKHSDPRSGVTTYRLTNISRSEPARSLFEVPPDYTLVDESSLKKRATKPRGSEKPSAPGSPSEPTSKPAPMNKSAPMNKPAPANKPAPPNKSVPAKTPERFL